MRWVRCRKRALGTRVGDNSLRTELTVGGSLARGATASGYLTTAP